MSFWIYIGVHYRLTYKMQFFRFGYVDFSTADEAKEAFENMNGQDIDGRSVVVDFANEIGGGGKNDFFHKTTDQLHRRIFVSMVAFYLWRSTAARYVVTLYYNVAIQLHANIPMSDNTTTHCGTQISCRL